MTLDINAIMSNESDPTAFLVAPMTYTRGRHATNTCVTTVVLGWLALRPMSDATRGLPIGLRWLYCALALGGAFSAVWLITGLYYRKHQTFRVDANGVAVEGGWSLTNRTYSWAELIGWQSESNSHGGLRLRLRFADGRTAYALYGRHVNWKRLCGRLEEILPATKKISLFRPELRQVPMFVDEADLFTGGAERVAK